jgi:hypothetical protein
MQAEHQHLPNMDRLSVLAATILLAYALLPFIQIPERNLVFQVLGVVFVFKINLSTLIAVISAALAATGTTWLLHDHPSPVGQKSSFTSQFQHWLLPALTAWVIGVPLNSLAVSLEWWAVFAFGGLLLVLVFVSEYIAVDPFDARHGPASVALTAVSYALTLILTIALVAAGSRLYVLLPALGVAIFFVTLHGLYLRLGGRWCFSWAAGITLATGQVAAALHYLPLTPLRYGLIILGLAYALASLAGSIEEGRPARSVWVEPVIMLVALWGLALFLRG